jgi:hypothetical protein
VEVRLLDAPGDAAERARTDALITARYGLRGRLWGALLRYARLEAAYLELRARGDGDAAKRSSSRSS